MQGDSTAPGPRSQRTETTRDGGTAERSDAGGFHGTRTSQSSDGANEGQGDGRAKRCRGIPGRRHHGPAASHSRARRLADPPGSFRSPVPPKGRTMGPERRHPVLDDRPDLHERLVEVFEDFLIGEAQDDPSTLAEPLVPAMIPHWIVVGDAINFDVHPQLTAREVGDERPYGVLTTEPHAELASTKGIPQHRLSLRRVGPVLSCESDKSPRCHDRQLPTPRPPFKTPRPLRPPFKGDGRGAQRRCRGIPGRTHAARPHPTHVLADSQTPLAHFVRPSPLKGGQAVSKSRPPFKGDGRAKRCRGIPRHPNLAAI